MQADARAAELAPYGEFASLEQARAETVSSLAQSRFDWERVLNELALVMPERVTLETLTGTVGCRRLREQRGRGLRRHRRSRDRRPVAADRRLRARPEGRRPAARIAARHRRRHPGWDAELGAADRRRRPGPPRLRPATTPAGPPATARPVPRSRASRSRSPSTRSRCRRPRRRRHHHAGSDHAGDTRRRPPTTAASPRPRPSSRAWRTRRPISRRRPAASPTQWGWATDEVERPHDRPRRRDPRARRGLLVPDPLPEARGGLGARRRR